MKTHKKAKKILLYLFYGIGDLVAALPAIKLFKESFPNIKLHLLTGPSAAKIAREQSYIDYVVIYPYYPLKVKDKMRFIKNIRSDNYDLTISFPREYNDRKNAFLSYFSGAKVRIGTNEDFLGKIFYTDLIKGDFYKEAWVERGIHYICEVKKVLSKKQGIDKVNDVNNILKNNCLFINKKIKERVKQRWQFLTKNDKKVVGIVNGSDERKRRFPKKFLYALLQELKKTLNNKVKVVMIDDAFKEFNALRKKDEDIQQQNNFYILLPDSVQGLVAVIGECDLVISNDTAGMHIANVFKKKLIAVFGPYLASSRIQAEKGRVSVVKPRNLPCYPCNKSAKMPCRGELYCYKEERIIPQIMEKLKYLL